MPGIFITGTDTEIGKTRVACALLHTLNKSNIKTVGMKPIASGAEQIDNQLKNDDAIKLSEASSVKLPYDLINPYVFKEPVSPHIAAELEQRYIVLDTIVDCYKTIKSQSEFVVVEGVGGWLAPVNQAQMVEDMALAMQLPVVMVVGMRLGCLNHAILTAERIQQSGAKLAGWIANCVDSHFSNLEENINTLIDRINAPLVARLDVHQINFSDKYDKNIGLLVDAN